MIKIAIVSRYIVAMGLVVSGACMVFGAPAAYAEKLTLDDSIKIALENNPTMHISRENLLKADASIDEAFAAGMPNITAESTYQRLDKIQRSLNNLDNMSAALAITQPIDIFGVIKTSKQAAKSGKASYEYEYEQTENDTVYEVKQAFYNVLRAQEYLKVQERTMAQLEAHVKDAQANYAVGTIAKFDVLRAETEVANARQGLISAQNGVQLAKSAFNNVLARPLDADVDLDEMPRSDFVNVTLAACIDTADSYRPEVLRAQSLIKFSDQMTKIAQLSSKPRFNLRWAYSYNFDDSELSPQGGSWQALLTTSSSVYDGGAAKAAADKAKSDANNARSAAEQIIKGVMLDAQQSHLRVNESKERITAADKGLEQAKEAKRLADVRYKGGVSTQLEVLDAQAALTLAETNYVNALYDYQIALAGLEKAVGGRTYMAKLIESSGQMMASEK
jgi:outer membrane protein